MGKEHFPVRREQKEMATPFPLLRELFALARERGLDDSSIGRYGGIEDPSPRAKIEKAPPQFQALTVDFPGDYYVVGLEDRTSSYNREGTRSKLVRLSTVPRRAASDERIRELDLAELDPSVGNLMEVTQTESIKNQSFEQINTAADDEAEQPHGFARRRFRVDTQGVKQQECLEFNRLDEGLFEWKGERKPVRWLRNLSIETRPKTPSTVTYEDMYIIGRHQSGQREERCQIKTLLRGSFEDPEQLMIEIGSGSRATAKVLYVDSAKHILILGHEPIGSEVYAMDILRQDPNYAFLFQEHIDPSDVLSVVQNKVQMLQQEWDKPHNVFATEQGIEPPTPRLEH